MSAAAETKLPGTETSPAEDPTEAARAAKSRAQDRKPKRSRGRPSNAEKRRENLEEQLASIGMVLAGAAAATGSQALAADGVAVINHASPIAEALANLAEANPRVAKLLDGTVTGSAWLGVFFAVAPLIMEVAGNHGLLPGGAGDELEGDQAEPATARAFADLSAAVNGAGGA